MKSETNIETGYRISNYRKVIDLLQSLYLPNIASGVYKVKLPSTSDKVKEEYGNYGKKEDFNIYIDGENCGTIFKPDIEKIKLKSSPSSFGKGTEKVYDESIRKGYHIEGKRLSVPYFDKDNKTLNYSTKYPIIKNQFLADNPNFILEKYKLHIYEKGGEFKEHHDSMQSIGHIGTYIVPIGVDTYKGGEFVITENESFTSGDPSKNQIHRIEATPSKDDDNVIDFKWIGFYNDCIHKVEKVKSGTRIVLQFNILNNQTLPKKKYDNDHNKLIKIGNSDKIYYSNEYQYLTYNWNSSRYYPSTDKSINQQLDSNSSIIDKLSIELSNAMKMTNLNCGIFLNHLYKANINESNLKGLDILLFEKLKESFGKDKIKIQTFLISINETEDSLDDSDSDSEEEDESHNEEWVKPYKESLYKISLLSNKTINEIKNNHDKYDIEYDEPKVHTMMFCGLKYTTLKSIYTHVEGYAGNEEVTRQDSGAFSAIIISK